MKRNQHRAMAEALRSASEEILRDPRFRGVMSEAVESAFDVAGVWPRHREAWREYFRLRLLREMGRALMAEARGGE